MSSKIFSAAPVGLECALVEVEADISAGLGSFVVVGLPDTSVQESRERVRSAIKNSDLAFPRTRITVNLAPADLKKEGPAYDLPLAVSLLLASGQINNESELIHDSVFIGELSLDGTLRPVNGVLLAALLCQEKKIKNLFLPRDNANEATLIEGLNVYPVENLNQLINHLNTKELIEAREKTLLSNEPGLNFEIDLAHIKGQEHAKRALEIAAAGAHNILMSGPPGTGKTLLAKALPSILPQLTLEEALEVTKIYSVSGLLPENQPLITMRPFRSPHHTASGVSLVGGGTWPKPGEISLAHRGVLFLDEFAEFPHSVLENLRQPLEDGIITVSRAAGTLQFPAKFILVAAQNPCPCGYYSDPDRQCICSASQIIKYQKRVSGPLLDRIDLHIEVPKIKFEKLDDDSQAEKSTAVRKRIEHARRLQAKRFKKLKILTNAEMSSQLVKEFCQIGMPARELLRNAVSQLHLSARSYFRLLKLSRTIADLAESETIELPHLAEALQYRPKVE
ncbi:MAG: YifB family Mg chelatase-like AAA ATPase [bacterium]